MMQKSFSIYGDSISTFDGVIVAENLVYYEGAQCETTGVYRPEDTWWMQVINHFDGRLLANAAFSGCMVDGVGFPAARTKERAAQIVGSDGESPDVVLVFVGINDYGWGSVEAQAAGRSDAAPRDALSLLQTAGVLKAEDAEDAVAGEAPSDATEVFFDAYKEMLTNIREVAPDADVWCISLLPGRIAGSEKPTFCYRLRGVDICEYNQAIREAAESAGCLFADIASFGFDYEAIDGTHPTIKGMRQIAQLVISAMEDSLEAKGELKGELVNDIFPAEMRSSRTCDEPTCIGCSFARSTGNKWSCVCEKYM